ncbi:DUF771 domain-containing protein [Lactococcus garvieae]|nr:DUF771 domain-containing protein [Lactococcus garvieae]
MEQQMLSAQVTLIIPEDKVLVDKVEYQELKKSKEITWNSMQEFCRYAGWNSVTMTKILLKPEVRNIIDISRNDNGWAYYGLGKGNHWWFIADKAKDFIKNDLKNHIGKD